MCGRLDESSSCSRLTKTTAGPVMPSPPPTRAVTCIAIGDVHGQLFKLMSLLEECRIEYADANPHFIFLGDLIDRGPDSASVIEIVRSMQLERPDKVTVLTGNHEDMLLEALHSEQALDDWLDNGGQQTLDSFGVKSPSDLPADLLGWLAALPTHYDDGLRFFVHAGVRPGIPLDRQERRDLLWIREPFLTSEIDHGRLVIHGHTPTANGMPDIRTNRINLDTGAGWGRKLTAAFFRDNQLQPVAFLQS